MRVVIYVFTEAIPRVVRLTDSAYAFRMWLVMDDAFSGLRSRVAHAAKLDRTYTTNIYFLLSNFTLRKKKQDNRSRSMMKIKKERERKK